jgi:hypothetical protein
VEEGSKEREYGAWLEQIRPLPQRMLVSFMRQSAQREQG